MRRGLCGSLVLLAACAGGGEGSGGGPPGDTTPPQVAITSPTGSDALSGTTVVEASASDDVGVVSVVFQVDGAILGPPLANPPWRALWDTASVVDGPHILTAVATDAAQNVGTSLPVPVDVSNATISPVLDFATLLGNQQQDTARDVFVDPAGFVYVTGGTESPSFPTTAGAYDRSFNGVHDAYLAKFAPSGALVFSTLLGGPNYDRAYAIEVDGLGFVTLAGRAGAGFPTTGGALQTAFAGDLDQNPIYGAQDGFVARFSPDGSTLVWSTYFGGPGQDAMRDVALDALGNAYVSQGVSRPFPYISPGAFDTTLSGPQDGIVAAISADGSHLLWGSYYGGSGVDGGTPSVRASADGTVWVLGITQSSDLPVTPGAYQPMLGGAYDMVLLKVAPGGGTLRYMTYFGGSGNEFSETHGLAVDASGEAVIAATTSSNDLPFVPAAIPPSFQAAFGGQGGPGSGAGTNYSGDGFVARISSDGTQLLAFTYLGGSAGEGIEGVAVDSTGRISVGGATYSTNFPVTSSAFQATKHAQSDSFLARFSADLSNLQFGTYFGGAGEDYGRSLAVGVDGRVVCVGMTGSPDYPATPGASDPTFGGVWDAFAFDVEF